MCFYGKMLRSNLKSKPEVRVFLISTIRAFFISLIEQICNKTDIFVCRCSLTCINFVSIIKMEMIIQLPVMCFCSEILNRCSRFAFYLKKNPWLEEKVILCVYMDIPKNIYFTHFILYT